MIETLTLEPDMANRAPKGGKPPTVKVDPEMKKMLEEIAEATFSSQHAVLNELLQAELPGMWKAIQPKLQAVRKLKAKSGGARPAENPARE